MAQATCTIDGCDGKPIGRGWCNKHYLRWRNHGDPLGGAVGPRVRKAVDHPDGTRECAMCGERKPLDAFDREAALEAQSISAATEEQSASTEEIASSSQSLAKLAGDLQEAVAKFQL